jgi:two-component system chemotaxis response regulator CheB
MSGLISHPPVPASHRRELPVSDQIRVMIVDDSIVARTVLSRIIEARDEFDVVAVAGNVAQALARLREHRVDIIILDIEMPGVDGLTALPELLAESAGARVLIVSSACESGAAATVKALTQGAADTMLKPGAGGLVGPFSEELVDRLLRIGRARHPARQRAGEEVLPAWSNDGPIKCIAIGASTGGIHALSSFFGALPADVRAPILITQHLPTEFMPYFAAQLQDLTGRKASAAADGARLKEGEILIAPGDAHMRLIRMRDGVRVRLDRTPAPSGCLPSVDPMFEAVAQIFGGAAIGVVLSGMGRDGTIGAAEMVAAGCEVIVQDAGSSVIWGMPGSVAKSGAATAILPPPELAAWVTGRSIVNGASRAWR